MPTSTAPHHVWYVAYGSNLARGRLQCYLTGTTPSGATRPMRGARDPAPPSRDEPCTIPGRLRFARLSSLWRGGVAFYEPGPTGHVLARRYLLTWSQFEDLFAQENGQITTPLAIAGSTPGPTGPTPHSPHDETGGKGWYQRIVELDTHDGIRSLTFTDSTPAPPKPPSERYLRWVIAGLAESHGAPPERIADYVMQASGVHPTFGRTDVVALCPAGPS